jgi:hypothetical protein
MAASIADEELARWNQGGATDPAHASNQRGYHPAPRVVVDVKAIGRVLPEKSSRSRFASVASLQAEARNQGYWPFRTCFELGLRENSELNGQIQMRVRIPVSGRVASARLHGTPLRSHRTVECVLRAAHNLTFKKPPARRVDIELQVKFWPGDAPLPPRSDVPGRAFDSAALTELLRANSTELGQCCADALRRDNHLWGRLAFSIQADATGRIFGSTESESHFPDREASECMRRALLRLPPLPAQSPNELVFAVRCGHPPIESTPGETAPASETPGSEEALPGADSESLSR